jgi:dienelactone hydrolase
LSLKQIRWQCYILLAAICFLSKFALAMEGPIAGTPFEQHVVRDTLGRRVTYYVTLPTSEPKPIMLVIQGSGCTPVLTMTAGGASSSVYNLQKFARDGRFTVISVEKPFSGLVKKAGSTPGCSDAFNSDFTAESWQIALQAALNDARKLGRVDRNRTLIFGSSEGAVMASVVAANDSSITDVVFMSGSGTTQLFDFIAQGYRGCFNVSACLADIEKDLVAIKSDPSSATKFAWGHPYKRWTSFFSIDPGDLLLRSKARVYIAIGTADDSVPAISQEIVVAKLLISGRDVTVRRVADGDHSLNHRDAKNWDQLDLEQEAALTWFSRAAIP